MCRRSEARPRFQRWRHRRTDSKLRQSIAGPELNVIGIADEPNDAAVIHRDALRLPRGPGRVNHIREVGRRYVDTWGLSVGAFEQVRIETNDRRTMRWKPSL